KFIFYVHQLQGLQELWSFCFGTSGPRSIAAAVEAKNSSPNCFLNAPTVLKEIKFIFYVHQLQGLQELWSFLVLFFR
ncbi:MAG: hypothetical protein ACI4GX_05560, partial [Ruminococcus sp.]